MGQKMTWEEIRNCYPETFVLLDNCEEKKIEDDKFLITMGEVILADDDSKIVYNEYCELGQPPHMTFGHTHWKTLEIEEVAFLGIRPAHV